MTAHRLLAIVPDALEGGEEIEEIRRAGDGSGAKVHVVVPAVEPTAFRHVLGDVDEPQRQAEERLRASLASLERSGIGASGAVGDPDPVQAAQDALLQAPADEVLIFEHAEGQTRWFENGLFEKAQETLELPLRLIVVDAAETAPHVVEVERTGAGTVGGEVEIPTSHNLPQVPRGDLAGMVMGIVGTIAVIVLAAAAAAGGDSVVIGWRAVAVGIAIAITLINMAHVVGLTLFESVHYHGGFAKFFRTLSLVGTPTAIVVNTLILLFA